MEKCRVLCEEGAKVNQDRRLRGRLRSHESLSQYASDFEDDLEEDEGGDADADGGNAHADASADAGAGADADAGAGAGAGADADADADADANAVGDHGGGDGELALDDGTEAVEESPTLRQRAQWREAGEGAVRSLEGSLKLSRGSCEDLCDVGCDEIEDAVVEQ
eukprot:352006-Pleurochrysis_carterae.AAC.1